MPLPSFLIPLLASCSGRENCQSGCSELRTLSGPLVTCVLMYFKGQHPCRALSLFPVMNAQSPTSSICAVKWQVRRVLLHRLTRCLPLLAGQSVPCVWNRSKKVKTLSQLQTLGISLIYQSIPGTRKHCECSTAVWFRQVMVLEFWVKTKFNKNCDYKSSDSLYSLCWQSA